MLETLLEKSEIALDTGDIDEALDLLRQAYEFQPDNSEIKNRYSKLKQRRNLEQKLREFELDYESRLSTNSRIDAHSTLEYAIELLLENLPPEHKQILTEILRLDGRLLSDDEWKIAQELRIKLCRSDNDWATYKACDLVDKWLKLGRDIATLGIIASAEAIGNLSEAYHLARDYLYRNPMSEDAIAQLASIMESLCDQISQSASKRLTRAKAAIQQEEYELAIKNLYEIDEVIYKEAEIEFPNLLLGDERVENIRAEANRLIPEAEKLHSIQIESRQKLEEVETLFLTGQFENAERVLLEIRDVPLNSVSKRTKNLTEQIKNARVNQARQMLHREVTNIQVSLDSLNSRDLSTALNHLQELPTEIDWHYLLDDDRQEYERIVNRIHRKLQIQSLFEQAEKSTEAGEYEKANAILSSIPTQENPEAQALLKQIEYELEKQRRNKLEQSVEKLLEKAKDDTYHKRFLTAQNILKEIVSLLGQVSEEYRVLWQVQIQNLKNDIEEASKIWALYTQAKEHVWEGQKTGESGNLREANGLLEQVIEVTATNEISREIQAQARELMDSMLMGVYMMDGNLDEVEKRLIAKMMVDPTNVKIRLNLIQVRATKDIDELTKQIKTESRLWFWATIIATIVAFAVFVTAVIFALLDNTIFASLTLLVTVLTGFLAKTFSNQYQQANQRSDNKLETKLEDFIRQQASEFEILEEA